jgi:hypothetical protein
MAYLSIAVNDNFPVVSVDESAIVDVAEVVILGGDSLCKLDQSNIKFLVRFVIKLAIIR